MCVDLKYSESVWIKIMHINILLYNLHGMLSIVTIWLLIYCLLTFSYKLKDLMADRSFLSCYWNYYLQTCDKFII